VSHLPGLFISPTQMGTAITTAISGIPVGELPTQVHLDIAAAIQALPAGSTPAQVQTAITTALAGQPVGELSAQVHADIAAAVAALPVGATPAQVTAAIMLATSGLADGVTISMSGGKLSVIGSAYQVLSGPILATDTLLVLRGTTPFLANQAEAQAWAGTSMTPSPTPTPTPSPSPTPTPTPSSGYTVSLLSQGDASGGAYAGHNGPTFSVVKNADGTNPSSVNVGYSPSNTTFSPPNGQAAYQPANLQYGHFSPAASFDITGTFYWWIQTPDGVSMAITGANPIVIS